MLRPATTRLAATGGQVHTPPGALRPVRCSSPAYLICDMWRGGRPNSSPPAAASSSTAQALGPCTAPQLWPQCPFRPAGSLLRRASGSPLLLIPARPACQLPIRLGPYHRLCRCSAERILLSASLVSRMERGLCAFSQPPRGRVRSDSRPDGVDNAGSLSG
ncbi:hypothetical protein NDU88_007450 [Pleurodeles waltl]|uniref:Uncharacterized protein n=1 Tax=Pleurodeles waltl TaxID=8319 RepID=A0AAV7PQ86_PLEWA|nr:hypothetical protein NDU88_007450 [Pleurodeles waltl]